MSYRAGLVDEPHVLCDGCSLKQTVCSPNGSPRAWFLRRGPPPGWVGGRVPIDEVRVRRWDLCPRCADDAALVAKLEATTEAGASKAPPP